MANIIVKLDDADMDALAERIAAKMAGSRETTAPPAESAGLKLLWTEQEAGPVLGVSPHTLKRWREQGYIASHTTARPILYSKEDLEAAAEWMKQRTADEE
jgi:hypothetical protein